MVDVKPATCGRGCSCRASNEQKRSNHPPILGEALAVAGGAPRPQAVGLVEEEGSDAPLGEDVVEELAVLAPRGEGRHSDHEDD
eukprot:5931416-Prymnesium_polylepis.2